MHVCVCVRVCMLTDYFMYFQYIHTQLGNYVCNGVTIAYVLNHTCPAGYLTYIRNGIITCALNHSYPAG